MDVIFDARTAEALAESPRHERARRLLTGEIGPLRSEPSAAFSADVAGLGYFLHLAWRQGRQVDMLKKLAVYEARERFGSRVRSEMARSGDPMEFAVNLLRKLGTTMDTINSHDLIWLRNWMGSARADWWRLQDRTAMEEAITACHLVGDWLWRIHEILADTDPEPYDHAWSLQ